MVERSMTWCGSKTVISASALARKRAFGRHYRHESSQPCCRHKRHVSNRDSAGPALCCCLCAEILFDGRKKSLLKWRTRWAAIHHLRHKDHGASTFLINPEKRPGGTTAAHSTRRSKRGAQQRPRARTRTLAWVHDSGRIDIANCESRSIYGHHASVLQNPLVKQHLRVPQEIIRGGYKPCTSCQ